MNRIYGQIDYKGAKSPGKEDIMSNRRNLSTLAVRTLLAVVASLSSSEWNSNRDIENAALAAVAACREKSPRLFPKEQESAARAVAVSACYVKAVRDSKLTVFDYLIGYAAEKWHQYMNGDKGAFGDFFEILVRIALLASLRLVRPSMLHVADCMKADVVSKRFGRLEIGHNGKTLSFGTLDDFMAGPYDSIAYGMLSNQDKEEIVILCIHGEIEKALEYVKSYTCIWTDKYRFQEDMNGLSRGAGITLKGADVQVVYNDSKYKAFLAAIENGKFLCMTDGVND